ncbi:GRB2-associated-binding protein 1-like isoform X2 [Genypterus blacodes]|uniref:GRB2-associated-binding protein 1-like isoform X2 n=1 Tax=Genypterus blacodes TaxID=154954 RepID=UPI003F76C91C
MSGAGEVVCEGWLRKSPPEKKLRRYAWKRRWFMLRSGRLSGEPDVLQYYKNQQSRRPIGTINLNLCEQVDAGLSFTKKELENSFVFDLKTEERTWYLVAESEVDMNRWVSSICLLCGFNPTDDERLPVSGSTTTTTSSTVPIAMATRSAPPPCDPVSLAHLETDRTTEEDYLWLSHCQSHIRMAPWNVSTVSSPLSQLQDTSLTSNFQQRAGRPRCHPSPHPRKHSLDLHLRPVGTSLGDDMHTHSGWHSSIHSNIIGGYQIPRPASNPLPRPAHCLSSTPNVDSQRQAELHASTPTPPPRPPKPLAVAAQGESSNRGSATLPRSTSESERREGGTEAGGENVEMRLPRINTAATPGCTQTGGDEAFEFNESFSSYFINKGLVPLGSVCCEEGDVDENYVPMSATPTEPPVAPRVPPPSSSANSDPCYPNYVPMTPLSTSLPSHPPPGLCEQASLGRQVPPPAHMGFRNSPLTPVAPVTPPLRKNPVNASAGAEVEAMPPPVHRNLKPQRIGVCATPPVNGSKTQTGGEPTHKPRVKPAPLDITQVQQEWQEVPPPVRSPVTRTFTRDLSSLQSVRASSAHSSSPSSDSDDPDDSYVAMTTSNLSFSAGEQSLRLMLHRASEGGASSHLQRPARGDKQVEYLDLDLHTGRATPVRQKNCTADGGAGGNERGDERGRAGEGRTRGHHARVDYVVVDPERTKALRNTREAWHDGRMSTEKEKC